MYLNPDTVAYQRESHAREPRTYLFTLTIFIRPLQVMIFVARHKKAGNTFPAYILEIKGGRGRFGVNR